MRYTQAYLLTPMKPVQAGAIRHPEISRLVRHSFSEGENTLAVIPEFRDLSAVALAKAKTLSLSSRKLPKAVIRDLIICRTVPIPVKYPYNPGINSCKKPATK
jgi:hypothetical protein